MISRKYGLGDGKVNVRSQFNSAVIRSRSELLASNNQTIINEIHDWERVDQETYEYYVCDSLNPSLYENTFQYGGLTSEFSKINTREDVEEFANKYGLLGFSHPDTKNNWPTENGDYASFEEFYTGHELSRFGFSELSVEPVTLWLKNAEQIRKLMKLYRLLRRYKNGASVELEENLINFNSISPNLYNVCWYDGTRTSLTYTESNLNTLSLTDIHRELLVNTVLIFIKDRIKITPKIVESSKTPLGFYVIDIPTSNQLLNAIYYDLWKMLGEEVNVELCANADCRLPFIKNKRQEYCDNSCKQQAYRNRKKA